MQCPQCHKNEAQRHPTLGVLPCESCTESNKEIARPHRLVEFTTDSIRDQRKEYARDIIQPWRGGTVSLEYIQEYGSESLGVSKRDIKNAKRVWTDLPNSHNLDKSKGGKQT